jgi:hypothetical protein
MDSSYSDDFENEEQYTKLNEIKIDVSDETKLNEIVNKCIENYQSKIYFDVLLDFEERTKGSKSKDCGEDKIYSDYDSRSSSGSLPTKKQLKTTAKADQENLDSSLVD